MLSVACVLRQEMASRRRAGAANETEEMLLEMQRSEWWYAQIYKSFIVR